MPDSAIAVFADHNAAEAAVKKLAAGGFAPVENAVLVGGLSALGAMLYGVGIPKDSVLQYETDIHADNFLIMAHGAPEDMARAKAILGAENPARLDVHADAKPTDILVGAML
jgi:hypothetical protein